MIYSVEIELTTYITMEVEAPTLEDAIDKAMTDTEEYTSYNRAVTAVTDENGETTYPNDWEGTPS